MAGRHEVTEETAWSWVRRAREVRVAAVVDGVPLLRTMHAAVVGRQLVFHSAPRCEKTAWEGAPVVAAVEEIVARVPSWMRHPERACPATTYYRSVQLRGRMATLDDPEQRAAGLRALMAALQPEGRHRPPTASDPMYARTIAGLAMWTLDVEHVSAVSKLGQHLRDEEMSRVLRGLWERGGPGDLEAIEDLRDAHPGRPTFWDRSGELVARCVPEGSRRGAWVGLEQGGRLVASGRGARDPRGRALLYDLRVEGESDELRGSLLELLQDHPELRGASQTLTYS